MKLGSYGDACRVLFRNMADQQARVDNILADLPEQKRREASQQVINAMAKQPGRAGAIASELIINGYLSGPGTVFVNALSGIAQMITQPLVRTVEALLPSAAVTRKYIDEKTGKEVFSAPEAKRLGEGAIMIKSIMQGTMEALAFAKQGFITGRPLEVDMNPRAWGQTDQQFKKFVKDNFIQEERAEMLKTQLYDYSQKQIPGRVGDAIRLPTRVGIFIDEFNKQVLRRMEYNALAYRKSEILAKKTGENADDIYKRMTAKSFGTEDWQKQVEAELGALGVKDIQKFAKEAVFQEKLTGFAATVAKLRAEHPWSVLIIPFVKTPYNILKEGVSYIPGTAPLIKKEIGDSGKFDWALNIPEERSKILAKQTIGLGLGITLTTLAKQGLITGSNPEDGSPPFSMKIGDTWVSYQKIEPLATVMGMSADTQKIIEDYKNNKNPDREASQYLAAYAEAIKKNVFEKSFMEGLSKAIFAMTDAERHGEAFLTQYANALVPTISATAARVLDPNERESMNFLERAQSRIPVLRESLPIKYKLTGGPEEPSLSGALLGIKVVNPTSVEKTLTELGVDIAPAPKKLKGVELSTEQYARLKELSGNLIAQSVERVQNDSRFMAQDKYKKEADMDMLVRNAKRAAALQLSQEIYKTDKDFGRKVYNAMLEKYGMQETIGYKQK